MRVFIQTALLILGIAASDSSIYSDVAGTLSKYFKSSLRTLQENDEKDGSREDFKVQQNRPEHGDRLPKISIIRDEPKIDRIYENQHASSPKTIIRIFKTDANDQDKSYLRENVRNFNKIKTLGPKKEVGNMKNSYSLDSVLNNIKRKHNMARRTLDSSDSSESSSMEIRQWKDEWKENWLSKKIEAINQTLPQGDVVNMVAARPWGVPCGDPDQHDMPWGTCMMAMECEAEYRIYRGDFQCGRTKFVCCALQLTNYDMYQGIDASFADSGLETDSEEQRNRGKGSKEKRLKKKERDRKRRRKARNKRKKKIKKNIKKIVKEIRKILNKQYRNGTTQRKRKTKQLKKFIKDLKKQYKQDRKSVKDIHELELIKIDNNLLSRLADIKGVNQNFFTNETFRQIILNGTITKKGARMLVEAYPELKPYFVDVTRRSGGKDEETPKDYDVEYGMLYY